MKDQFYLHFETMPKATAQQKGVSIIHGKPHFYEKANVRNARTEFTLALKEHRPKVPSELPIKLKICFCFDVKDKKKWGQPKPTKPDTDNYLKLLKDCMTAEGFWQDDSQVASELTEKFYGEHEGIYVRVEEMENGKG